MEINNDKRARMGGGVEDRLGRNKDAEGGVATPIERWLGQRTCASILSRFRLFENTRTRGDSKICTSRFCPFGKVPSLSRMAVGSFPRSRPSKTYGANCATSPARRKPPPASSIVNSPLRILSSPRYSCRLTTGRLHKEICFP